MPYRQRRVSALKVCDEADVELLLGKSGSCAIPRVAGREEPRPERNGSLEQKLPVPAKHGESVSRSGSQLLPQGKLIVFFSSCIIEPEISSS